MERAGKINILLVDDQPGKLVSYEAMLAELDENLFKARSANEAFAQLLKNEMAVVLVDVCMPDLDGFQLAAMIREHPRFEKTAIIFISAIHLADDDRLTGYRMGAVDYVPVPVVPDILRAKIRVFAELYRKTRQLEDLNAQLEQRVMERTAELEASNGMLRDSEHRRSMALAAGKMGSWDWDVKNGEVLWDDQHYHLLGVAPEEYEVSHENLKRIIHPDDWNKLLQLVERARGGARSFQIEARFTRPDGEEHCCLVTAAASFHGGELSRLSGVTADITERKRAEDRHALLAREVDHRAKNALALVQSIIRLTRAPTTEAYVSAIEGRITALSNAHVLLSESRWQGASLKSLVVDELAPYQSTGPDRVSTDGPDIVLQPAAAQSLALILHELATNSAKYGALSLPDGRLTVSWQRGACEIALDWTESGVSPVSPPKTRGFGITVITATVQSQLRGKVTFDWPEDGLRCGLLFPAAREVGPGPEEISAKESNLSAANGRAFLIVEDEMLIAMVMRDILADLGFDIAGPCTTVGDALRVVRAGNLAGAVLDVNLNGEFVYDVADLLASQGIPFVFVTGYGRESIDSRFADVPIINKPVDSPTLRRTLSEIGVRKLAIVAA